MLALFISAQPFATKTQRHRDTEKKVQGKPDLIWIISITYNKLCVH